MSKSSSMDRKRTTAQNAKTSSQAKAKSFSSLKIKGDCVSGESYKISLNKNSPASLQARLNTHYSGSGKSTGKDARPKSNNNPIEICGNPLTEEAKLDLIDCSYTSSINSAALKILLGKSKLKSNADIDKQIATLQKRVTDNLNALEETKAKVSTLYLLQDQNSLLTHQSAAYQLFSNDPALTEGKSFEELMIEIDRMKNQLPCKSVHVPETNAEMANFQAATTQLLGSLERISAVYGADQGPIMHTASELQKINMLRASVEASKHGVDCISSTASTSILKTEFVSTDKP